MLRDTQACPVRACARVCAQLEDMDYRLGWALRDLRAHQLVLRAQGELSLHLSGLPHNLQQQVRVALRASGANGVAGARSRGLRQGVGRLWGARGQTSDQAARAPAAPAASGRGWQAWGGMMPACGPWSADFASAPAAQRVAQDLFFRTQVFDQIDRGAELLGDGGSATVHAVTINGKELAVKVRRRPHAALRPPPPFAPGGRLGAVAARGPSSWQRRGGRACCGRSVPVPAHGRGRRGSTPAGGRGRDDRLRDPRAAPPSCVLQVMPLFDINTARPYHFRDITTCLLHELSPYIEMPLHTFLRLKDDEVEGTQYFLYTVWPRRRAAAAAVGGRGRGKGEGRGCGCAGGDGGAV